MPHWPRLIIAMGRISTHWAQLKNSRPFNKLILTFFAALANGLLWFAWTGFRPAVLTVTPLDRADWVSPDAAIAVAFTAPMAAKTINNNTVELRDSNGAKVPATVVYDKGRRVARVKPDVPLRPGDTYELRVTGKLHSGPSSWLGLPLLRPATARFKIAGALKISSSSAPILIVTDERSPYGSYYAEILLAEGLNLFSSIDIREFKPEQLDKADIIILAASPSNLATVDLLDQWVRSGGNLIVINPQEAMLPLLGLVDAGPILPNAYLQADRASPISRGIAQEKLQIHAPAHRFELRNGASIAQLVEASTQQSLSNPAVTLRKVGLGHAAAFTYDLAQSIILTRQGNPEWINQERDGILPRRTNDLFYPNHIDLDKAAVPQADEQQRLLANLILGMNSERRPLPRFWYLPEGRKAVMIMAGDDHATPNGTRDAFSLLSKASPYGCRNDAWECYRATSYITHNTSITSEQMRLYIQAGFELGIHVDTGCANQDNTTVQLALSHQIDTFGRREMGFNKQETHRIHCIVWNGWADTAKIERTHGIRFSMDYYYWPGSWVKGRSGFMTGSGFPMRFADVDGTILDIYQAASHIVNENGIDHAEGMRTLIKKALGPEQYFGAFGTHYDYSDSFHETALSVAEQNKIALISAEQMLHWLDGRNNSRFNDIMWKDYKLDFNVQLEPRAAFAMVMLPLWSQGERISHIICEGERVTFEAEKIKGLEYAMFLGRSGRCIATYEAGNSSAPIP